MKPSAHFEPQLPCSQTATALAGTGHVTWHEPQALGSAFRSVSQPLAAWPSQLPRPESQTRQVPWSHHERPSAEQALSQAPQLVESDSRFCSQPFSGLPSQSSKPSRQVNSHSPLLQWPWAWAGGQFAPHTGAVVAIGFGTGSCSYESRERKEQLPNSHGTPAMHTPHQSNSRIMRHHHARDWRRQRVGHAIGGMRSDCRNAIVDRDRAFDGSSVSIHEARAAADWRAGCVHGELFSLRCDRARGMGGAPRPGPTCGRRCVGDRAVLMPSLLCLSFTSPVSFDSSCLPVTDESYSASALTGTTLWRHGSRKPAHRVQKHQRKRGLLVSGKRSQSWNPMARDARAR